MIGLLVFGLVVLSVVCLWLLIEQRKSWKFLIWFIPILLILVTSTYVTYTSILGFPKFSIPEKGLYLKHHIDEPKWIYLWILGRDNIPMSYQIVYSRKAHNSLEGVKGKADEGKFMVLGEDVEGQEGGGSEQDDGSNQSGGGFSIGGDISFYEWDYAEQMAPKDTQQ
tara:strand:+ start:1433 stop:1933 length:501 start_codon:yes stop_codon:yes gene_type:complete